MARIVLGCYMFRYPLGGMLSWALQYLLGLKDLGHDVYAGSVGTNPERGSIKGPISVPVSPSNAVECYPCR